MKKRKGVGRPAAYDWDALRHMYVTADPALTVTELARREKVPVSTMTNHCTSDGWVSARERYWGEIAQRRREQAMQEHTLKGVASLDAIGASISALDSQIREMLAELAVRDIQEVPTTKLLALTASATTALDKAVRARELLTGGADSRQQIDLVGLLAGGHLSRGPGSDADAEVGYVDVDSTDES